MSINEIKIGARLELINGLEKKGGDVSQIPTIFIFLWAVFENFPGAKFRFLPP